jgi:HSP20 family protein
MPGLIIWKNQELNKLKRDMDRLFSRVWEEFDIPLFARPPVEIPYIDLVETTDALIAQAEIPDIDPQDLDISITNDLLTIKGEIKQEINTEEDGVYRRASNQGFFSRTVQLPCKISIEQVEATYKDGLLRLFMPKCAPEEAREIKIKIK